MVAATVLELIKSKYPDAVKNWDEWDYKIFGPVSLDDLPRLYVHLINKNKRLVVVYLRLDGV